MTILAVLLLILCGWQLRGLWETDRAWKKDVDTLERRLDAAFDRLEKDHRDVGEGLSE